MMTDTDTGTGSERDDAPIDGDERTIDAGADGPTAPGAGAWPGSEPGDVWSPPAPDPTPSADTRNLGAVAHLSAFVGLAGVPSFIGPLVVWLLHRERDPWVAEQAREALNFNLSVLIYAGGALALTILTIGLGLLVVVPAALVAAVGWLVVTVLAAIRAADGEIYRYPLTLRLVN